MLQIAMCGNPVHPGGATRGALAATAACVFAAALSAYLLTLAPTFTAEDSGELAAAVHVGGVPHPPGYPTWCVLTGMMDRALAAFGGSGGTGLASPAYRANLASALYAALAAAVLFLLVERVTGSLVPAATAALAMAFGLTFWSQAVITEVYTLNVLFLAATLYAVFRWREGKSPAWLLAASAAAGLSLGNHWPLAALACAPIAAFAAIEGWRRRRLLVPARSGAPVWIASGALLLLCAAAPYVDMLLRARSAPPVSWGDPSTLRRLLEHAGRVSYRELEDAAAVGLGDKVRFYGQFAGLLWSQWTPAFLVPAAAGAAILWRRDRALVLLCAAMLLMNPIALVARLHFPFDFDHRGRVVEYYLPAYAVIALLGGAGLDWLCRALARVRRPLALVALAFAALPLAANWRANDMSRYRIADDYNRAALDGAPAGAVISAASDYVAFPLLYLTVVEGRRPDVLLATVCGDDMPGRVLDLFARGGLVSPVARGALLRAGIRPTADDVLRAYREAERDLSRGGRLKKALARSVVLASLAEGGRPVLFPSRLEIPFASAPDPARPDASYFDVVPDGLFLRLERGRAAKPAGFPAAGIRNLDDAPSKLGEQGRLLAVCYRAMQAEHLVRDGRLEEAEAALRRAAEIADDDDRWLNNLGATAAVDGLWRLAEQLFRRALELNARSGSARANLIALYRQLLAYATGEERGRIESRLDEELAASRAQGSPGR